MNITFYLVNINKSAAKDTKGTGSPSCHLSFAKDLGNLVLTSFNEIQREGVGSIDYNIVFW